MMFGSYGGMMRGGNTDATVGRGRWADRVAADGASGVGGDGDAP